MTPSPSFPDRRPRAESPRIAGQRAIRLVLALAVVLLGGLVLLMSSRVIATATAAFGDTFTSGADGAAVPVVALGAALPSPPTLLTPAGEYTNIATVTVRGILPSGLPPTDTVRLYRIGQSTVAGANVVVAQVPVGPLPEFEFEKVSLTLGVNNFSATVRGPSGETAQSGRILIVYSTTKPKVVVASPVRGAVITSPTVAVVGTAPAGSAVVVRDLSESAGSAVTADAHGTFRAVVALAAGKNVLSIVVTDRAGNTSTTSLTVQRSASVRSH